MPTVVSVPTARPQVAVAAVAGLLIAAGVAALAIAVEGRLAASLVVARVGRIGSPPRALRLRLIHPALPRGSPRCWCPGTTLDDRPSKRRVCAATRRWQRVRPGAWRGACPRWRVGCARRVPVRNRHAAWGRLRLRHAQRGRRRQRPHGHYSGRLHRGLSDRHGAPALVARSAAHRHRFRSQTRWAGRPASRCSLPPSACSCWARSHWERRRHGAHEPLAWGAGGGWRERLLHGGWPLAWGALALALLNLATLLIAGHPWSVTWGFRALGRLGWPMRSASASPTGPSGNGRARRGKLAAGVTHETVSVMNVGLIPGRVTGCRARRTLRAPGAGLPPVRWRAP